ncbi:MAG: dihydroneopterin aldolase [Acidiferrobacterales bacterium]|nr:dihydroneopterin aldolase [Acidiferrobacterales bacterium]
MQCTCRIGVWDWEKRIDQTLVLDIDLATDIKPAAQSDDLKDTLDYKKISDRVIEFAQENTFDLIETLIERLAQLILAEFDVSWLRIKLDKGGVVKNVNHVGIVIERGTKS